MYALMLLALLASSNQVTAQTQPSFTYEKWCEKVRNDFQDNFPQEQIRMYSCSKGFDEKGRNEFTINMTTIVNDK